MDGFAVPFVHKPQKWQLVGFLKHGVVGAERRDGHGGRSRHIVKCLIVEPSRSAGELVDRLTDKRDGDADVGKLRARFGGAER